MISALVSAYLFASQSEAAQALCPGGQACTADTDSEDAGLMQIQRMQPPSDGMDDCKTDFEHEFHSHMTLVDVEAPSRNKSFCYGEYCGPNTYMHYLGGFEGGLRCQRAAPPDGCQRYWLVEYFPECDLKTAAADLKVNSFDDDGAFLPGGVLKACNAHVKKKTTMCFEPSGNANGPPGKRCPCKIDPEVPAADSGDGLTHCQTDFGRTFDSHTTLVDVEAPSRNKSFCYGKYCGPNTYMHYLGGFEGGLKCQRAAPPDGCQRYWIVDYTAECDLKTAAAGLQINSFDDNGAFDHEGVLNACSGFVKSKQSVCFKPSGLQNGPPGVRCPCAEIEEITKGTGLEECTADFGYELNSHMTLIDVEAPSRDENFCFGEPPNQVCGPNTYIHYLGGFEDGLKCQRAAPPDGCQRYWLVEYFDECDVLKETRLADLAINTFDTAGAFLRGGVLKACQQYVKTKHTMCFEPSGNPDGPPGKRCSCALPRRTYSA